MTACSATASDSAIYDALSFLSSAVSSAVSANVVVAVTDAVIAESAAADAVAIRCHCTSFGFH